MREDFQVGAPLPQAIGPRADLLHEIRELRLAMEKEVSRVQARESEIRESIINDLSASDDTGAAGQHYRAQIVVKSKPRVDDWTAFTAWVAETGRFDCLQRRTSDKAVMEMIEAGEAPPGVEKMLVKDVSIQKI